MRAEDAATALAARFEGYRPAAYQDSVGIWTVGYGTIRLDGRPVHAGDTLDAEPALALLKARVASDAAAIRKAARKGSSENQIAALISLAYNVGLSGVLNSTALRCHNASDRMGAAKGVLMWCKAGGVEVPGLMRRRCAEAELYLTP